MSGSEWTVLRSDSDRNAAMIVPEGTTKIDALARILSDEFGGEWSSADPGLTLEAERVTIARWWSCRKDWKESHGVDPDTDWWAPDGDGSRAVWVATHPENAYDLGERLVDEAASAVPS